jgi:hypothetical protein
MGLRGVRLGFWGFDPTIIGGFAVSELVFLGFDPTIIGGSYAMIGRAPLGSGLNRRESPHHSLLLAMATTLADTARM